MSTPLPTHVPLMRSEWRTDTVVSLCAAMRQERDYSAFPILADALQDAGCTSDLLLTTLRAEPRPNDILCQRMVAIVMSADTQRAVEYMDAIVEKHAIYATGWGSDHTETSGYERLMEETGGDYFCFTGNGGEGAQEDVDMNEFNAAVEKITGRTSRISQFGCSC